MFRQATTCQQIVTHGVTFLVLSFIVPSDKSHLFAFLVWEARSLTIHLAWGEQLAKAVIDTASEFNFQHACLIHIFCLCFVYHTQETGTPIQETAADVCDVKK